MLVYSLPPKILCRVANVLLKAEPDTDEVFAQVTLMPESNQDENTVKKEPLPPPPPCCRVHSFCKTLTASDTSSHGHVMTTSNPRVGGKRYAWQRVAIQTYLSWSTTKAPPSEWLERLSHNCLPSLSRLGPTCLLQRSENGELRVGVRRALRQEGHFPSSVISSHSMNLGVLATAWAPMGDANKFTLHNL
ncbi:unnamed protein product [Fraxinus pennsylvanica]|uniref:Uncharacterized protein n=1 Tax=Fraxinus pennsylvanica TaxID=56036 RepID=A0AAD1ZUU9_9LAMI|nr:unnamed protein product [Fraxinus pennsylvanica]